MTSVAYRSLAVALFLSAGRITLADNAPDHLPVLENFSTGSKWSTDIHQALAKAAAEKKYLLLNFTGSDWCVWCHRLQEQVFSQAAFLDYAHQQLVLVEIDFPVKTAQAPELKSQNEALSKRFNVHGYPTIVLLDAEGRELGRTGYMQGGAKTFVRELKRLATRPSPDAAPAP